VAPIPSTRPVPQYHPPGENGLDARARDVQAEHAALLARLKLCHGADRAAFDRELLPLVQGYANFVHRLPATADGFFCEPGGLMRLGLETAFFALQGTDAHIFSGKATISERVELEPRWRLATFIGGLCSALHRALQATVVTDDGAVWPACLGPLAPWLAQQGAQRYTVHWPAEVRMAVRPQGFSLFALPHVVPPAVLHNLAVGNAVIVPHLLASIGGVALVEHNVLDRLVRRSAALVIHRDLLAQSRRHGTPAAGEYLAQLVLDAVRRLAAGHAAWVPNQDKSRVWYGMDGLYLLWPGSGQDVLALLEGDELAGLPASSDALLDVLQAAGALAMRTADAPTWTIHPPGAKGPLVAIKLVSPALVLVGLPALALPIDAWLAQRTPTAAKSPAPVEGAAPPSKAESASPLRHSAPSPQFDAAGQRELSTLLDAGATTAVAEADTPSPTGPSPRFKPPLRLHPGVRTAIDQVIAAHGHSATLHRVDGGVFIALDEFQQRGIQPALALRALRDAGLLKAGRRGEPARTLPMDGVDVPGVLLTAEHFDGLDMLQAVGAPTSITIATAPIA
jgi:conjugal transfer pilus assembly protein TraI